MISDTGSITIGTRGSKLALFQANKVRSEIEKYFPGIYDVKIKPITTAGDIIQDTQSTDIIGGVKGLFTKQIDHQLLQGQIDIAVHSVKDLASILPPGLILASVLEREDPSDALITNIADDLKSLPKNTIIGTSSIRRNLFLKAYRSDFQIVNYRGNIITRLEKLDKGAVEATIMAVSGLKRLALESRITTVINNDIMLPCVGQGAIGIIIRENDSKMSEAMKYLNHSSSKIEIDCERIFAKEFGASCNTPLAANAIIRGNEISIKAAFIHSDNLEIIKAEAYGLIEQYEAIAINVAHKIKEQI